MVAPPNGCSTKNIQAEIHHGLHLHFACMCILGIFESLEFGSKSMKELSISSSSQSSSDCYVVASHLLHAKIGLLTASMHIHWSCLIMHLIINASSMLMFTSTRPFHLENIYNNMHIVSHIFSRASDISNGC